MSLDEAKKIVAQAPRFYALRDKLIAAAPEKAVAA